MPNDSQDSAVLEARSSSTERSSTLRLSSAPDPLCAVRSVSLKRERWILGKPRVRYFPSLGFHAYGKPRLANVWFSCSLSYPREGCQRMMFKMWLNSFSVSLTSSRCSQNNTEHTTDMLVSHWGFGIDFIFGLQVSGSVKIWNEWQYEWMCLCYVHANLIQISSVYHFD